MTILSGWFPRLTIHSADSNGPWGSSGGGDDDKSGGPRNPWAQPPSGKPRNSGAGPSALDEFLKRARSSGGGGGGFGSGGRPRIPGAPGAGQLWAIGVGLVAVAWIGLTSIHSIGPQQRGLVTTLGRYSGTLEPGIRFTLPAPFVDVTEVDVAAINTDTFPDESGNDSPTDKLMLTSDQNIIDLDYSVRWQIANPQDFAFQIDDPRATLRATAQSAMRAAVATATLDDAIGSGRNEIEDKVRQSMQEILDRYNAGIRIQGVAIKGAQAPVQVADAFKEVSAAQQKAQGDISKARGYAQQVLAKAQGEAAAFDVIYAQYKLAPEVTRRRMYYDTMEQVLSKSDKTIIEAPGVMPYLPLPRVTRSGPETVLPAPVVQNQGAAQ
ncbi:protease modulator HflK [Sphingomonas sp. MMS24-J45]|uniref:protease modulator HflK n=1 Tax=Sphingomonas sp. MMS24-J45 TaxID=3238806 RepID=UPI00384C2DE6